jgi:RecA/RadA recombinase
MIRTKKTEPLSKQVKRHVLKEKEIEKAFEGNFETMTSTGSTLLDLCISGTRVRGGGVQSGILFVAYGPSQSGKTALLAEMAGNIIKNKGDVQFNDPESRLDQEFGSIFGMHIDKENYHTPDTVTQVFKNLRDWKPKSNKVNGVFADSLAALSTDLEMENDDGDKMGGRRAKEFSEQLRKHARLLKDNNYIFACSNQIREKMDAGKYEAKYSFPGGKALWFYSTIVCRFGTPKQIVKTISIKGKEVVGTIGIEVEITVEKTADRPYRKTPLIITYGYGIDDIRANLQYLKKYKGYTTYCLGENKLSQSLDEAIKIIESCPDSINELKEEVIDLWEEIEHEFDSNRKKIR